MKLIKTPAESITDFEDLFPIDKALMRVLVVSGYYDNQSIKQLFEMLKKRRDKRSSSEFVIIVDAFASRCYSDSKMLGKLSAINQKAREIFSHERSGVYLAKTSPLFHPKGYLVESRTTGRFILGSLNLTNKGLTKNEELILSLSYNIAGKGKENRIAQDFKHYVDDLFKRKVLTRLDCVDTKTTPSSSLRDVLISGRLYSEFKAQDPFRFDLNLPDEVVKEISSLNPMLESKTSNTISITKIIEDENNGLGIKIPHSTVIKSQWKKYCLQSCYGYWAPQCYLENIEEELVKKSDARRPFYTEMITIISNQDDLVFQALEKVCQTISERIESDYPGLTWKYSNPNELKNGWNKWLLLFKIKTGNSEYIKRLSSGISNVSVPDVWCDHVSKEEFEKSIFEAMIYEWQKSGDNGSRNLLASRVLNELEPSSPFSDIESLSERITEYIDKNCGEELFYWDYEAP